MEVSEEQKRRIEANRARALARRNAKVQCPGSMEPFSNSVRLPMQPRLTPQSDVISPNWNHTATKASSDGRLQASPSRGLKLPVNKEDNALIHSVSGSPFCGSRIAQHCGGFSLLNVPEQHLLHGRGTGVEIVKVGVAICAPDRFSLMLKSGRALQAFFENVSCTLDQSDADLTMVAISHGSLISPLLGDYNENIQNSCSTALQCDEVVVVIPSESQDGKIPDESPANQSKNTFQQIHALNQNRSNDYSRIGSRCRGQSVHNPIQKKPLVARAKYCAKTDRWSFLHNLMMGLFMWPKWSWDAMKKNSNLTILAAKSGLCAGLCCLPSVVKLPEPFTVVSAVVSAIALWAVITTDLLFEENIGLSISKGCNRVMGTLFGGCLGFILVQFGLKLGPIHPYFVVFCVAMSGFIFRFLKEQWGYASTVASIAFHIIIIYGYLYPERGTLPMSRFFMISFGFVMSIIVNLAFRPIYAGDALHNLVAKNFETAANVFERCVEEYIKDTKLDHAPGILSGLCEGDKNHQSHHEIVTPDSDFDKLVSVVELLRQLVMSDTDMEKLSSAVLWEPPHGNFFMGYPWHLYDDIANCLRNTLYDVLALDLCLEANIQAPKHLRDIFAQEMTTIATECATVLRILGDSVKNMKKFSSENIMTRAEEAAVALQSKIQQNTEVLFGSTTEPKHSGTPQSSQPSIHQPVLDQDDLISANKGGTNKSRKDTILHKKSSLGPHGDSTLERISALSLVKFASLLIEVVAKMRLVVDCVENFSEQAKFQACSN